MAKWCDFFFDGVTKRKSVKLKKETEGLITAAQDQSLRTNVMKARICNRFECSLIHSVLRHNTFYNGHADMCCKS